MLSFEITSEDVATALKVSEDTAEDLMMDLDFDEINEAALSCNGMDKQLKAAHKEIKRQYAELS